MQLILVTATLSRRNLRDVAVVAGKSAGKIGLVVPSMAGAADRALRPPQRYARWVVRLWAAPLPSRRQLPQRRWRQSCPL